VGYESYWTTEREGAAGHRRKNVRNRVRGRAFLRVRVRRGDGSGGSTYSGEERDEETLREGKPSEGRSNFRPRVMGTVCFRWALRKCT